MALSLLGALASASLAARLLPDRGSLDRAQAAILLGLASVLTCVQALGAAGQLRRAPLAVCGLCLFGAQLAFAGRGALVGLRRDLQAPLRLVREAWAEREPLALAVPAAAFALGVQALLAVCFRAWGWDAVWYHVPITNLAIQAHGLGFVRTSGEWLLGYPRNLELLSVWNVLLPRSTLLENVAQLPFAALGCLSLMAWTRRLGASRPLAAGLGACFALAPPVFLQAGATYVDVACGALLLTCWTWLTAPRFGRAEMWMASGALAMYAGTKFTGLYHAALLAPIFLWRLRRERPGLAEAALLCGAVFWLGGGLVYARNLQAFGNPLWPFRTRLPLLGIVLPGRYDSSTFFVPPIWQQPRGALLVLRSWYTRAQPGAMWQDVRSGGFGPLFRFLGIPCLAAALVLAARWRMRAAAVLGLFAVAMAAPDPWWPRYTLCAGAAAIAAVALVLAALPRLAARAGSLVALTLALAGLVEAWPGLVTLPLLPRALRVSAAERALLQPIDWTWPEPACRLRETELRAGDAVATQTTYFLADFWTNDLRNRVVFVEHPADAGGAPGPSADARYLDALRSEGAVWAAARPRSHGERALSASGAQPLFVTPREPQVVFRLR